MANKNETLNNNGKKVSNGGGGGGVANEGDALSNSRGRESITSETSSLYSSPYEKCMNLMKNGEWAMLEAWLRRINRIEFELNAIDEVFFKSIFCIVFKIS